MKVALTIAAAAVLCFLAACPPSGSGPTRYVLTVQGVYCKANPSGAVSVDQGVATTISATANSGFSWTAGSGWTVLSGTASIASPSSSSTTVTLNAGDATIQASCPVPSGKLVLTIVCVNCTTSPSDNAAVGSGATAIAATATPGHSAPAPGTIIWAVVTGAATITDNTSMSTTVTLTSDATIKATIP